MTIKQQVRRAARRFGIDRVGFATAADLGGASGLPEWLRRERHGTMSWLTRGVERRLDPGRVLEGARTVVSVAINYFHGAPDGRALDGPLSEGRGPDGPLSDGRGPEPPAGAGRISRYAWGSDYHKIIKRTLLRLLEELRGTWPEVGARLYVDTGPVLEKPWAHRAGVGWVGKNGNLITRAFGSWVFLGELLLDRPVEPDTPATDHCGTCTRCIEACPTAAIVAPQVVDARRCISYLTIEHRGPIDPELRPGMGDWLFGCDICQDVCPWNKFQEVSAEARFAPRDGLRHPDLVALANLDQDAFDQRFAGTNIRRTGWLGFLRNTAIALGNGGDAGRARAPLTTLLAHPAALVRGHAVWALGRLGERGLLRRQAAVETEEEVRRELERALQE